MISEENLRFIAETFNGFQSDDTLFSYKTGSEIFHFFNHYFNYSDTYGWNVLHPSRWEITTEKFHDLLKKNAFANFIEISLSLQYLHSEFPNETKSQLAQRQLKIISTINDHLVIDEIKIISQNGFCKLVKINEDEVVLGIGGFACCYLIKSKNIVEKRLKQEFYLNSDIIHRFKREFEIMTSLKDLPGVVQVFSYDERSFSYTMERGELDLQAYIERNNISFEQKMLIIYEILDTMEEVHNRDIIHRDLSPSNILLFDNLFKISDFGLGKNLDVFYSHQTIYTNSVGNYMYCDPRQFVKLKEGDKLSDIYSLGKIINFVLTKDPSNINHPLKSVVEKATNQNDVFRYQNISFMKLAIKKQLIFLNSKEKKDTLEDNINKGIIDEETYTYFLTLDSKTIFHRMKNKKFLRYCENILCSSFFHDENIQEWLSNFIKGLNSIRILFEDSDLLGYFGGFIILSTRFSFVAKELGVELLNIPLRMNRYGIESYTKTNILSQIEPALEAEIYDFDNQKTSKII